MYEYPANVIRVIDGDTIEVDIDLGFSVHMRTIVRLLGINAPERGTPGGATATSAITAKLWATSIVLRTPTAPALAHDPKQEKYGRWLAVVWANGENVNEWMVANGYAAPYMAHGASEASWRAKAPPG